MLIGKIFIIPWLYHANVSHEKRDNELTTDLKAMTESSTADMDRRSLLKLVGTTGIAASIAGCSDDDAGGDDDIAEPDAIPDTFVKAATQVYGDIDPAKQTDYTEAMATTNFYEPVVFVDSNREITERMAVSWDLEEDGRTWVFELREGVPFHDGGEMTAEDVVYSLDRMMEIQQGYSSLWQGVYEAGNAEARDEYTVAIELNKEFGPFLATLVQMNVVDSQTVRENEVDGDMGQEYLNETTAGTGPYLLEEWSSGEEMIYERFDDYWQGWEDGQIERVRTPIVGEDSTIVTMIQEGEVDMTSQFMGTDNYEAMAEMDHVRVPEESQWQLFHLPINASKPPTDDVHVRRAIAYAFNYDTAVNQIFRGGEVAQGPVPRGMPGHNDDVPVSEQDMDAAQDELEQASYSVEEINEIGLEHVYVAGDDLQEQIHLVLADSLSDLGIEIEGRSEQWATITDIAGDSDKTAHLTNIFRTATTPTPDGHTYQMFHPDEHGSYVAQTWHDNRELGDVLDRARTADTEEERTEAYQEAQAMITEEQYSVFVANPPYRIAISDRVDGWTYRGLLSFDFNWHDLTWQ